MSLVSGGLEAQKICIVAETDQLVKAGQWSQFLSAPLNPPSVENYFFRIYISAERIFVQDREKRNLEINFDQNHLDYERKGHRGKNELIAKALGASKGCKRVLDLSVGLAVDSVFLSQLGFQVIGVERSPVLYLLLQEAFSKSQKQSLEGYELHFSDSFDFLKKQKKQILVDSIYFDPMYPHKKKSALPKQEMMVFRDLVGHDNDAAEVLAEALKWPVKRVVVKRPRIAEPLLPGVMHSYEGKVVRYDTYMVG